MISYHLKLVSGISIDYFFQGRAGNLCSVTTLNGFKLLVTKLKSFHIFVDKISLNAF